MLTTGPQNYRNETREVTELGPHALHKRTIKSTRKKKERQSKANPKRTCHPRTPLASYAPARRH